MDERFKDYRWRLIFELEDLVIKIEKLQKYIFKDAPAEKNTLLEEKQLNAMVAYREALEERIYDEMINSNSVVNINSDGIGLSVGGKDLLNIINEPVDLSVGRR